MPEQPEEYATKPPTAAQNRFAIILTFSFLAVVVLGGWYLRSHNGGQGGAGSGTHIAQGGGSSAESPLQMGNVTAQLKGEFRMPESEINVEFKDAQGRPVDVGQVRLALDMNMQGMLMHESAEVRGSGGHYTARVKPQMAGSWVARLSYSGKQGTAQKSFQVLVR
jgi:YtkA-like protein